MTSSLGRRLRTLEAAAPPPAAPGPDFSALTPDERRFLAAMIDRAIDGETPNEDEDWTRCEALLQRVKVAEPANRGAAR